MAQSTRVAKTPAIETQALKAVSKSEGMRMLFEAGYTVTQVKAVFNAPYGFVYGVAQRAGFAETAANRKVAKAKPVAAKGVAKRAPAKVVTSRPTDKAKVGTAATIVKRGPGRPKKVVEAPAPVAKKATASVPATVPTPKVVKVASGGQPIRTNGTKPNGTATSAVARVAAKLAAKQPGRPTAARREANRKSSASA